MSRRPVPRPVRWLAATLGLLLGVAGCGGTPETPEASGPPSQPAQSPPDLFAQLRLSVVSIEVGPSAASGMVVSTEGHILTTDLVVSGAAGDPVTVTFHTGQSSQASIVGDDPRTGLAVIHVDGAAGIPLTVFADSDSVRFGDQVRILGGPLVSGDPVSSGTVVDTSLAAGGYSAIATDAQPILGSAGGPTTGQDGVVIGITAGVRSGGGSEISFSVPSNLAARVADQLITGEPVTHPYLGVAAGAADGAGALVQQVAAGSPAAQAGLLPRDVITRVGDRPVADPDDLLAAVQSGRVGDQVEVGYTRDGAEQELTVTLGLAPTE